MPLTKEKRKLHKLIQQSDSDDSEHELSYYVNDRVKLMKEVLKTIKSKKIKTMAPACLKDMDMEELNSMLLEELLGISNKRLKYIFNGQNIDEDSSSSTNEDEPIDIISLDDISDDEFVINLDDDADDSGPKLKKVKKEHHRHSKVKKEKEKCNVKKEKPTTRGKDKHSTLNKKQDTDKQSGGHIDSNKNLMSVLELLELQARARAIKSQLLLENAKTQESISEAKTTRVEGEVESDDDVIIETTKTEEIVITSSESEDELNKASAKQKKKGKPQDPIENITEVSSQPTSGKSCGSKKVEGIICESQEPDTSNQDSDSITNKADKSAQSSSNVNISKEKHAMVTESKRGSEIGRFQINIIENKELLPSESKTVAEIKTSVNEIIENSGINTAKTRIDEKRSEENENQTDMQTENQSCEDEQSEKVVDNEETIVINLSDDEMDELK